MLCSVCCPAFGQRDAGPTRVVVGNVIKTKRAALQSFVGTLEATRKTTVGSAVDGRVTAVKIEPGDPVVADSKSNTESIGGQVLVEIRSDSLKIELQTAELQHQQMQQALSELELSLPQDMELAAANQQRDKSQMSYTKSTFQRLKNLQNKNNAISTIELEEARSQYLAAEQAYIGSRATVRRLSSTRDLQLQQGRSRVDTAFQETLRLKDMLNQYTVRAPFGGVVTQKLTEVGQWVTRGQALCEIVQLDPIEMIVNVPQEFTGRLQESMEKANESDAKLTVKIEVNGIEKPLEGKLLRVIPQADLRSRSFPVRIRIKNPPVGDTFQLKPGMLGRASLSIGREAEVVLVKKDALVLGIGQNQIFKIAGSANKTTAVSVPVQTGIEVGGWIQVIGNVDQDDQVILIGNERLKSGAAIMVTETRNESLSD